MDQEQSDKSTESPALPAAGISETLGLLEFIDDQGGSDKIYRLASALNIDTDTLLDTVKAAELFGFIELGSKTVKLKPLGKQMIETEMNTKKQLMLEQLRKISLFALVKTWLEEKDDHRMPRDEMLEALQQLMPHEKADEQFEILVNWGRWGEFLGYSKDDDFVYLDQG